MAFLVWCPVLYLLTLFVTRATLDAYVDAGDGLGEVIGRMFVGFFLFGIGGHVAHKALVDFELGQRQPLQVSQ